jgi:predicted enzyme related to lactoylglutathione lyase
MFNFRVSDLEAFLKQLKKNDVKIDEKRQNESYGKFAWVYDPEGNKIELWEPIQ